MAAGGQHLHCRGVTTVNPKPKPPMPGGEYTFMVDTGPQQVPPGVRTVNLIPVGDGGPGPLLPRMKWRPKPLLPRPEEIAKLPRLARVAFAARCARRVFPVVRRDWTEIPGDYHTKLRATVLVVEQSAVHPNPPAAHALVCEVRVIGNTAAKAGRPAAAAAVFAAHGAAAAVALDSAQGIEDAVLRAAEAILRVCSDPADLSFIRRDFERFRWLAKKHGWTDDTPVSPDLVGPLWPRGRVPHWAREKKKPRE